MSFIMNRLFLKHLKEQNETYTKHFCVAASIGVSSCFFGIAQIIHAFIPGIDIFKIHGTTSEKCLNDIIKKINRNKKE